MSTGSPVYIFPNKKSAGLKHKEKETNSWKYIPLLKYQWSFSHLYPPNYIYFVTRKLKITLEPELWPFFSIPDLTALAIKDAGQNPACY